MNAHRLIHWAGLEGRQTFAVASLFKAYFIQGLDIGDTDVLTDLADKIGLDREMMTKLFAGDGDVDTLSARDSHARERGVTGVPTFVIGNKHVVAGAQSAELWDSVIDDLLQALEKNETDNPQD